MENSLVIPTVFFISLLEVEFHHVIRHFSRDRLGVEEETFLMFVDTSNNREWDIAIGPVAVVSILVGTLVKNEIDDVKSPDYLCLVFTSTFFVCAFQALLEICRLGFLIDFLSHASIVGLMGGVAIIIGLQQLKGFLGIKEIHKENRRYLCNEVCMGRSYHGWNWGTILIGTIFLCFLMTAKYIGKKKKRFFWVPAIAPLVSAILSTLLVFLTPANKQQILTNEKEHRDYVSSERHHSYNGDASRAGNENDHSHTRNVRDCEHA